MDLIANSYYFT